MIIGKGLFLRNCEPFAMGTEHEMAAIRKRKLLKLVNGVAANQV